MSAALSPAVARSLAQDLQARNRQLLVFALCFFPTFSFTDYVLAPHVIGYTVAARLAFELYAAGALLWMRRRPDRGRIGLLYATVGCAAAASTAVMFFNRDLSASVILSLIPLLLAMMVPQPPRHAVGLTALCFGVLQVLPVVTMLAQGHPDRQLGLTSLFFGFSVLCLATLISVVGYRAKLGYLQSLEALEARNLQLEQSFARDHARAAELEGVVQQIGGALVDLDGSIEGLRRESQQLFASARQMSSSLEETVQENERVALTLAAIDENLRDNRAKVEEYGRWQQQQASPARAQLQSGAQQMAHSANQIGSLSQVVGAIAEETMVLSLNARLEAARQAERGGFAVVAQSMRRLADDVGRGAEDIGKLVQRVVGLTETVERRVGEHAGESRRAADGFTQTLQDVRLISEQLADIRRSMVTLAAGSEQQSGTVSALTGAAARLDNSVATLTGITRSLGEMAKALSAGR